MVRVMSDKKMEKKNTTKQQDKFYIRANAAIKETMQLEFPENVTINIAARKAQLHVTPQIALQICTSAIELQEFTTSLALQQQMRCTLCSAVHNALDVALLIYLCSFCNNTCWSIPRCLGHANVIIK